MLILKIIFSLICGLILSTSTPGNDWWLVAWVGIAPLFILIGISRNVFEVSIFSFVFGLAYNLLCLKWIFTIHSLSWLGFSEQLSYLISFSAWIIASVICSAFFIFFGIVTYYINKQSNNNNKGILGCLLNSFIWVVIFNKLASLSIFLGFPWSLVEYSQYKNFYLIQIAELFGSIFISVLIVFFNNVIANIVLWFIRVDKIGNRYIAKNPDELTNVYTSLFGIVLVLLSVYIFGHIRSLKYLNQKYTSKSKIVMIAQGNLPIKATRGKRLDIVLARSTYEDLIPKSMVDFIFIPEGALPTAVNLDSLTKSWIESLSYKTGANVIAGSYCTNQDMITNCGIGYSSKDKEYVYYEKERLVPFGEYVPFYFILPGFLKDFVDQAIGNGFSTGKNSAVSKISKVPIGISICFEIIFPNKIRNYVLNNARMLVNLSDLSWFSSNLPKKQFLAFSVFRAVENRKPFILATNNGISAIIQPSGIIKKQTYPKSQSKLIDWVNLNGEKTFYAKFGW